MTEAREGRLERPSPLARLRLLLAEPRDIASLAALRVMFGALLCVSALRFVANGWVERFYGQRTFFFKYSGFGWVEPLSAHGMLAVYLAIALLGALVCAGLLYRFAIVGLFVLFTYAELCDVTNYLNHYYLVSLVALLLCFMPLSGAFSLDARWGIVQRRDWLPTWMIGLLRFQVGVVYLYAAKAKWGADWLLRGQPLQSWLLELVDWPLVGGWLLVPGAALVIGWLGMLHDLCVPGLLLWRRTRGVGYAALVVFHGVTGGAFSIGIFPVLMPVLATVFFDAGWVRRLVAFTSPSPSPSTTTSTSTWVVVALWICCLVQVLVPLRSHLYGGNVLWHEQGMRYAWKVLVRAKHGSVRYRAQLPDGREIVVSPREFLTLEQEREMAGQPDLILQLGHHVGEVLRARGRAPVAVRVDALVAFNGRPAARMIDPEVDLLKIEDGLRKADWILPAPP